MSKQITTIVELEEASYEACLGSFKVLLKGRLELLLLHELNVVQIPSNPYLAALIEAIVLYEECQCAEPLLETSAIGWKCMKCEKRRG